MSLLAVSTVYGGLFCITWMIWSVQLLHSMSGSVTVAVRMTLTAPSAIRSMRIMLPLPPGSIMPVRSSVGKLLVCGLPATIALPLLAGGMRNVSPFGLNEMRNQLG